MKQVYLVQGATQGYGEWRSWVVCAYTEEEMALLHRDRANDWLKEHLLFDQSDKPRSQQRRICDLEPYQLHNPFDTWMHVDQDGARYRVVELPLYLHLDQFLEEHG